MFNLITVLLWEITCIFIFKSKQAVWTDPVQERLVLGRLGDEDGSASGQEHGRESGGHQEQHHQDHGHCGDPRVEAGEREKKKRKSANVTFVITIDSVVTIFFR